VTKNKERKKGTKKQKTKKRRRRRRKDSTRPTYRLAPDKMMAAATNS